MAALNIVEHWKKLHDYFKGDPGKLTMATIPMLFASEIPIYFFTLLDYLALPSLAKFRLHYGGDFAEHLGQRVYPPWDVVKATAKVAEFNFLFAYAIPGALMIHIANKLGIFVYDTEREITWKRLIKESIAISIVADLMFYAVHRVVHLDGWYQYFHKKHHEFKYSFAMVHHYMRFREALLFAFPQALPPLVIALLARQRMHVLSMWVAFVFTQIAGILGHAGWKVPWPEWVPLMKPHYHDAHHVDYSVNFGAIYEFTDGLFGTLLKVPLASSEEIMAQGRKVFDYVKTAPTLHEWPRFP